MLISKIRVLNSIALLLALNVPLAAAQTADEAAGQLEKLKQQISKLEQQIDAELGDRTSLQRELRDRDREIADLSLRQKDLKLRIETLGSRAGELNLQRDQLETEVQLSRERIQRLLREQYQQGRQPRLKLILSNRSPNELDRMMRYYEGLSDAIDQQAQAFSAQLDALASTNIDIDTNAAELAAEAALLETQQRELETVRIKRLKTLARITDAIDQKRGRVSSLNADVERLAQLLEEINRSVDLFELSSGSEAFTASQGKLPWPVKGAVIQTFGSERSRDGIVIAVEAGNSVFAVHPGRVVFAEWLRGYGLLIIVDHGQGYMTLYGHNQSLLRQTGDWVSINDAIAVSGSSGGYSRPALYFSIRREAKSVDPIKWLEPR